MATCCLHVFSPSDLCTHGGQVGLVGERHGCFQCPGTAQISPEIKTRDRDVMRMETAEQFTMQPVRVRLGDLVLDRDVGTPCLHILGTKPVNEVSVQPMSDCVQVRAFQSKGDTASQITHAVHLG